MKEKGKRKSEKVAIALLFTFSLLVFTSNAVSISSPEIGTFFDLNGMIPNSVPADRTFGSDDATNSTHRLDPQEQAAVNAVFEAYFERVYYGNAGLLNVWNEEHYGPTANSVSELRRFRFNPPSGYGSSHFHYDPDTNRVIRTRRFAEYDNLRHLCRELYSIGSAVRPDEFLGIYRPSWYRNEGLTPMWSSTLFDGLTLEHGRPETEFPEISWCDKRSFLGHGDKYYWANLTLRWVDIGFSRDDPVNWEHERGRWSSCPAEDMVWRVQFGDPPHGNDMSLEGYFPYWEGITNLTMDVVGRGYAVSNVTRETRHWDAVRFTLGSSAPSSSSGVVAGVIRSVIEDALARNTEPVASRTVSGSIGVHAPSHAVEGMCYNFPNTHDGPYSWVMVDFLIRFDDPGLVPREYTVEATEEAGPPDMCEYTSSYRDEVEVNTHEFSFSCDVDGLGYVTDFRPGIGTDDVLFTLSFDYCAEVTNITRHVGLEGLTNETRRLVSDNLSALGLGLSALDRSYCKVTHAIPQVVSNFYASAVRTYSEDFPIGPVFFDWDSSLNAWVHVVGEIDVPPLDTVIYESSSVSNVEATSYGDFCVYANPARLSASVGSFVTPDSETEVVVRWESDSDLVDEFGDHVLQFVPDNGRVEVDLIDLSVDGLGNIRLSCYALWADEDSGDFVPFSQYLGQLRTSYNNVNVSAVFSSSTGYEFGRTFKTDQLDRRTGFMPYPGDFSRVDTDAKPVLWTMFGRGFKGGYDKDHEFAMKSGASMRSVAYEASPGLMQAFDYSCAKGSFHSVQTAFSTADGHYASLVSSCMQKFESATGLDFWDPISMLDIVSAGVPDALSHVVFSGVLGLSLTPLCGTDASGPAVLEHIVFEVRDGAISDVRATCYDHGKNEYFEGTPPYDIYSTSVVLREDNTKVRDGHEPANHDFHGGAVAGRMTSLSRVNWDWKALKRERNNQ